MKFSTFRSIAVAVTVTVAGALALAMPARANATHDAFVDVAGSVAADGYNELVSSRITAATVTPGNASYNIRAGILGNVDMGAVELGGAIFKRTSGTAYPATSGLYEWGGPRSTFELAVADAVSDLGSVVFQAFVNVDTSQGVFGLLDAANMPRLSYNGGSQFLSATTFTATPVAGGVDMNGDPITVPNPNNPSYTMFKWDLSSVSGAIDSFKLTWATDAHANTMAFQLDQVAAVPEPETLAFGLIGLGIVAVMNQRRRRAA